VNFDGEQRLLLKDESDRARTAHLPWSNRWRARKGVSAEEQHRGEP